MDGVDERGHVPGEDAAEHVHRGAPGGGAGAPVGGRAHHENAAQEGEQPDPRHRPEGGEDQSFQLPSRAFAYARTVEG